METAKEDQVTGATSGSSDPPAIRPPDARNHVLLPIDPYTDILELVDLFGELTIDVPGHVASRVLIQLVNLTQQETVVFVGQHAGTGRRRFGKDTVNVAERRNISVCDLSREFDEMLNRPTEAVRSSCPDACRDSNLDGC